MRLAATLGHHHEVELALMFGSQVRGEGWTAPATVAECFHRLAEHHVTATALRRAVGFRHVVAHGYAGIDVTATYAAATTGLEDLDHFAREVATWLVGRPG